MTWVIKSYPTASNRISRVVPVTLVTYTITAVIPPIMSLIPTMIAQVVLATSAGVPVLSGGAAMVCVVALIVAWPHSVLCHIEVEIEIFDPCELFRSAITLER